MIDYFDTTPEPLTAYELEQMDVYGRHLFSWLKNEWVMAQHEDFINNRYMPAFRSAINPLLSSYTVNEVYEYTIAQGLSVETADFVYKKAVKLYHGEVNG